MKAIYLAITGKQVSQSVNIFISDQGHRPKFIKRQVTPKVWVNTASQRKRQEIKGTLHRGRKDTKKMPLRPSLQVSNAVLSLKAE